MKNLEIISEVMAQHKALIGQLESASDSVSDMEALLRLERARSDLVLGFHKKLSEKSSQLEQIIIPLDRGLRAHYTFEEQTLPPLLGRTLTEALIFEHKQLLYEMDQAISLISNAKVEGLTHNEEMEKESEIYQGLDNLRQKKMDHLNREDAILLTLQNVIQLQTEIR